MARKAKDSGNTGKPENVVPFATKKRGGTPANAHVPTSESRQLVQAYCWSGLTQERIASHLGISVPTLTKHYRDELDHGKEKMLAKVASTIFGIATQTRDLKASLTASIFILKTQGGWRENADTKTDDGNNREVEVSLNIGDKEPKTA